MIQRSFDSDQLREAIAPYEDMVGEDFDPQEWMENEDNIALHDGNSLGLFEYEYPGVYSGHYFFEVRGRKALDLAKQMLIEVFTNYGARTIKGMTPMNRKGARWMNRQLGFQSYGTYEWGDDEYELFCVTIDQFFHHINNDKET